MDLSTKTLNALRSLAARLGEPKPTAYRKDQLIKIIENRKTDLENNVTPPERSKLGRPHLDNGYIGIERDENGKIIFFDTEEPLSLRFVPENEPKVIIKKRPAAITDPGIRKTLTEVKSLLQSLYIALDKVLERD